MTGETDSRVWATPRTGDGFPIGVGMTRGRGRVLIVLRFQARFDCLRNGRLYPLHSLKLDEGEGR